jgi:lysozyme family protein
MTDRFARALPLVLAAEGGFVDHPRDPGGRTNMGVTQRAYDDWQAYIGADRRDVIDITAREVEQIYRVRYWDAVHGDALPAGLAYVVFDAGVNSGPARAVKWLQAAVGVAVDGICGPQTLAAVQTCDTAAAIRAICAARLAYCRQLATWSDFGSGWTARISRVEADALKFAAGVTPDPVASPLPMAAARGDVSITAAGEALAKSAPAWAGVGSVVAGGAALANGAGPVQWAIAAVVVLCALCGAVVVLQRAMSRASA